MLVLLGQLKRVKFTTYGQSNKSINFFDDTTGIAEYNLEHYDGAGPMKYLIKKPQSFI
jgi:hypothetical protein